MRSFRTYAGRFSARKHGALAAGLVAICGYVFASSASATPQGKPYEAPAISEPEIQGVNEFGSRFQREIWKDPQANLIFAPWSIEEAFALVSLGLEHGFRNGDFHLITPRCAPGECWISKALHKGFIQVDEEGTEAAAATAVVPMTKSVHSAPSPHVLLANHPFLSFVLERKSGTALFRGRLTRPDQATEDHRKVIGF